MHALIRPLLGLLLPLLLLIAPSVALAGPVSWQEVPATSAGRQWWDSGSLRLDREGYLSVLSRFQPAPLEGEERPGSSQLYVMQLDCDQALYRDTSVNGLPHWGASWQTSAGDDLTAAVLAAACRAGNDLLAARHG